MRKLIIEIEDDLHNKLEQTSKIEYRSKTSLIKKAISEYCNQILKDNQLINNSIEMKT